jgi:hypothetical protein
MFEQMPLANRLVTRSAGVVAAVLLAFVALLTYSVHERRVANGLSAQNLEMQSSLKDTRGQIAALTSKLDSVIATQQTPKPSPVHATASKSSRSVVRHRAEDPRWSRFQNQLNEQGKAIESTRQDLTSTRTELQGSIATTHEELVALQKRGERNYYEFDLDKSKQFRHSGPVGISLRKANTKHQYADLELLVDDAQVSKKHLNLFEPAMFYQPDSHQPMELVINSISKNHIHGYISTPKYKASELKAASTGTSNENGAIASSVNGQASSSSDPKTRQRLQIPR